MANPETRHQLLAAVAACDDKKGEDTRILELDPADSGLADFFLITSGSNDRQVQAIADEIEFRLKKEFGLYPSSVEGRRQGEWILLDYVDIVVHVFLAEKRAFYDIERLRKSARHLTSAELEAELKTALAEKTRAVRNSAPSQKAAKKAVKVTTSKSPATKAIKPTTSSANISRKGDSTVTAKPAKKAAKKSAAKASFKPSKELAVKSKPKTVAAKASGSKTASKPALKSAAKPKSILKRVNAAPSGPIDGVEVGTFGAKPPIVKCEAPDATPSASLAASAAPKTAKKPAKKAPALVVNKIRGAAKPPIKQIGK
jgi:ribosome-associated protein